MVDPIEPLDADAYEAEWHNGNGEALDHHSVNVLQLAHQAIAKFPDLAKRHKKFIGTMTVVGPVVIGLASLAVTRRLHHGQSPERILAEITPDEIESIGREKYQKREKPQNGNGRFSH